MSSELIGNQAIATRQLAIEQVALGSRVPTKNPHAWEYDDSLPKPEQSTWRQINVRFQKYDGSLVHMQYLRPQTWIDTHHLTAGSNFAINVPELELHGEARVEDILPCPEITNGDGAIVTGRIVTEQAEHLVQLTLDTGETITGTPVHPFWWVDRQLWVSMSELQAGETLQGTAGPVKIIASKQLRHICPVYNLEVHGEHVYEVGIDGVLVHNAYTKKAGPHLNSNNAVSNYGIYEIRVNGHVHKIGKADLNRVTLSSGLPTRLHQQVRKLERLFGKNNVVPSILLDLGEVTTSFAKSAEQTFILAEFIKSKFLPQGNLRSFSP